MPTILMILLSLSACAGSHETIVPPETVIPVGSSVSGPTAEGGTLTVTALTPTKRQFEWGTGHATYDLVPRDHRWQGALGIGVPRQPRHDEVGKVLAGILPAEFEPIAENQLHFHSYATVLQYLHAARDSSGSTGTRWTRDGLTVLLYAQGSVVTAWISQLCINGKKPANLPGASGAVAIKDAAGRPSSTLPCAHVDASSYADI